MLRFSAGYNADDLAIYEIKQVRKCRPTHHREGVQASCLVDDAITEDLSEDSPRGYACDWGFPTQSLTREKMHVGLHVECLLLLSDFIQNLNVLTTFSVTLISNFMLFSGSRGNAERLTW